MTTNPDRPATKRVRVVLAESEIRDAVDRTKAALLATPGSLVASLDSGHRIPTEHLWYLIDTATTLLNHDCPEPSPVSPVAEDTGLRERLAQRFAELDARDWGYDHGFVAYGTDEESDAFVDAAAEMFEQAHGDLVARNAVLRSERDALARHVEQVREMREHYRQNWLRAVACSAPAIPDDGEIAQLIHNHVVPVPDDDHSTAWTLRLSSVHAAESAILAYVNGRRSAPAIPQDADVRPENAAYLRWCEWPTCLRSFDVRTGPSEGDGKGWIYVRTGMHVLLCPDHANTGHRPQRPEWEPGDTTIRTSCECGERSGDLTPTNHATCSAWWSEHVAALSAPAADPSPATCPECRCADPIHKTWCPEIDGAATPGCSCLACAPAGGMRVMNLCPSCGNKRCPGAANHRNTCTGSNAPGQPGSLYADVLPSGQAPAQPTATPDAPTCGATEGGMGVDCRLPAGHRGWHDAHHTPRTDGTESIGYPFNIQWPRFGWDRCAPENPDAREDTATRPWTGHDVYVSHSPVHDDLAVAMCQDPDCHANTGGPGKQVEDWADRHRADTLRPSGPLAPIKTDTEEA